LFRLAISFPRNQGSKRVTWSFRSTTVAFCIVAFLATGTARSDGSGDPAPVSAEDGKWSDKDGNPTFKVDNGKVDFYSYNGFVRYSANCLQCHGPDGLGSTYAPSLLESLQRLSYQDFLSVVANGKKDVSNSSNLVMPSLGTNRNVMCYIDSIFIYLRARSDDAIGRGRPENHEPKPDAFSKAEDACMG
jgi:methanol metabolism-related c-type cytochrome